MTPLIPIAIGAGLLYAASQTSAAQSTSKSTGSRKALDPHMDAMISEAVTLAIANEKDASVLNDLAAALDAAAFHNSAQAVAAQAQKLATAT